MTESPVTATREQFDLLTEYVAPRSATEEKLAQIWSKAMGLDRVGIEDQFEDLGGTSLLAASIFAEIEKMFGVTAPMAMLVEAPTVQELAQRIDDLVQSSRG